MQPYKGSRDFYPEDKRIFDWIFSQIRSVAQSHGFEEYDGPLLEPFELYEAKSGSELVNDQLYWFVDRGDRKVAIRPEMTPTLARMVAGRLQELAKPIRWISVPNVWRYERPQKGRLREHWQANIDILGGTGPLADVEILNVLLGIFEKFGAQSSVSIRINNRKLMDFFFNEVLHAETEQKAPLARLIDAKAKLKPEIFEEGLKKLGLDDEKIKSIYRFFDSDLESVQKNYDCDGARELAHLFSVLQKSKSQSGPLPFVFDPSLMRGLDYYTATVFEAFDTSGENPRALCGGGRYDNLIGLFSNQKLSGVGFGLGDVTLRDFLESHKKIPLLAKVPEIFVGLHRDEDYALCEKIAGELRSFGHKVVTPLNVDGFGTQIKEALKCGAQFVVLLGETEIKQGQVLVKDLARNIQEVVEIGDLKNFFSK